MLLIRAADSDTVLRRSFSGKCRSVSSNNHCLLVTYIGCPPPQKSFTDIPDYLTMIIFIYIAFCIYNMCRTVVTLLFGHWCVYSVATCK